MFTSSVTDKYEDHFPEISVTRKYQKKKRKYTNLLLKAEKDEKQLFSSFLTFFFILSDDLLKVMKSFS